MSTPFAAPNTDRTTVLCIAIRDLIIANKGELGVVDVFYGKHTMVPNSPTVVIKPGRKSRELRGVAAPGGRTQNQLMVLIDVMAADVISSEEQARLDIDTLAENVEKLLHVDTTIGGYVIHGFVENWDPGEIFIDKSQWRMVRMTYLAKTITYLSPPAAPI